MSNPANRGLEQLREFSFSYEYLFLFGHSQIPNSHLQPLVGCTFGAQDSWSVGFGLLIKQPTTNSQQKLVHISLKTLCVGTHTHTRSSHKPKTPKNMGKRNDQSGEWW